MAYRLSVQGHPDADDLRSLASFLAAEPELRGRVDFDDSEPDPGQLGAVADAIVVAVGSGGALTVLTTAVAAWVQSRGSTIRVRLHSPTGATAEIDAENIKSLDAAGLGQLVRDVDRALLENSRPPG
jgi:hypothetical protein